MTRRTVYDPDKATRYYPCGEKRLVVFEAYSGTTTLHRQRQSKGTKKRRWVRDRDFPVLIFDDAADADARAKKLAEEP